MKRIALITLTAVLSLSACGSTKEAPAPIVPAPSVVTPAPDAPEVTEAPEPEVTESPEVEEVYYANCDAARKAGAAPVKEGNPGYGTHLDRNGDGVACE